MKKKILCGLLALASTATVFMAGVYAGGNLESISAYLNHGLSIAKDGQVQVLTDSEGNKMTPITYNDSTYLPVRAVSELLGHPVGWDGDTQCVLLDNSSVPESLKASAPVQQPVQTTGDVIIPDVNSTTIDLGFLDTLIARVGNGKLVYSDYNLENQIINGVWQGREYDVSGDIAHAYLSIDIETSDHKVASEIAALENALCEALVANGYTLAKVDEEYGTKHYVKGKSEYRVWNVADTNLTLQIQAYSNWQSCCAEGHM